MTYRLFNRTGSVSPLGALLCQYSETSLDIEKEKNNLLCQHCYRELNALSKRELELIRNKEELKEKMRKADIYFTRMKRCRGSKDTDSLLSTPVRESITPSGKRPPAPTDSPARPSSSRVLFKSPTSAKNATCISGQERSKLASKLPTLLPQCVKECGIQVSSHDLDMEVRQSFDHLICLSNAYSYTLVSKLYMEIKCMIIILLCLYMTGKCIYDEDTTDHLMLGRC